MLLTFSSSFLAMLLVCMSSTQALTLPKLPPHDDFQHRSLLTTSHAFETYTANPRLFITPPPLPPPTTKTPSESKSEPTYTGGYDDDDDKDDENQRPHQLVFRMTKPQLEDFLRKTLHIDFRLQVVSAPNKDKDDEREVLGGIPVQITIHNFRLGGLSAPHVFSQSWNEQHNPGNYGNIRI